jgi:hypothetical protein
MDIINILEINNGTPHSITSFPILDKKNKKEVVKKAESYFISCIEQHEDSFSGEDFDECLDNGSYTNNSGNEVYLIWS